MNSSIHLQLSFLIRQRRKFIVTKLYCVHRSSFLSSSTTLATFLPISFVFKRTHLMVTPINHLSNSRYEKKRSKSSFRSVRDLRTTAHLVEPTQCSLCGTGPIGGAADQTLLIEVVQYLLIRVCSFLANVSHRKKNVINSLLVSRRRK